MAMQATLDIATDHILMWDMAQRSAAISLTPHEARLLQRDIEIALAKLNRRQAEQTRQREQLAHSGNLASTEIKVTGSVDWGRLLEIV